jgi:ribosomal protein S18 acetylase RimI-like enzyme
MADLSNVMRCEELALSVAVRLCEERDLEELEWFGAFRDHRHAIQLAYQRQLKGENWMLVADVRGFPIGQLWIDLTAKTQVATLWAFRVMPPFKGLGIGSMLLACAEQLAQRSEVPCMDVGVEPGNVGAQRLYERSGFQQIGTEQTGYETQDATGLRVRHTFDVLVLRKRLTPPRSL